MCWPLLLFSFYLLKRIVRLFFSFVFFVTRSALRFLLFILFLGLVNFTRHPTFNINSSVNLNNLLVQDCDRRVPKENGQIIERRLPSSALSFQTWSPGNDTRAGVVLSIESNPIFRALSVKRGRGTLLDIGAGYGTISMAVLAMPQLHSVIAVEHQLDSVDALCMSAHLNGWCGRPGFTLVYAEASNQSDSEWKKGFGLQTSVLDGLLVGKGVTSVRGDDLLRVAGWTPDIIRVSMSEGTLQMLWGLEKFLREAKAGSLFVLLEAGEVKFIMTDMAQLIREITSFMTQVLHYEAHCGGEVKIVEDDGEWIVSKKIVNWGPEEMRCEGVVFAKNVRTLMWG